jgi:hypothetical protein
MSDQPNRIAALLNPAPSSAAATPVDTTGTGTGTGTATSVDTTGPATGTVAYDIPPGQDASTDQLGIDTTPDALISVDGHQVAAGDNGLSVDIAPDGSAHVVHGPQDAAQPGGQNGGTYVPGPAFPPGTQANGTQPPGAATAQPGTQPGTQPGGADANGAAPVTGSTGQPNQTGQPGSTGQPGPTGQQGGAPDPTQPDTPIEHLHGIGPHAAQADLAVFGPGTHAPPTVTHRNPDGSLDVTIPKGPDNPHAVTVHVQPNKDGSLDLTVPKSATNPHEIKIHVQPDKHVDLNITQDKDGHLKIDAHDHPPGQKGDWPGLKQPAGQAPPPGTQDPGAGGPGAGDPLTPGVPKMPGGASPGGGSPGGASPGGGAPGNGKSKPPAKPAKPPGPAKPTTGTGYASIREQSIRDLGKDIDTGPVQTMDTAHKDAANINVGYPGFGVAGAVGGLASAHTEVRDAGAKQFMDGHTSLSKWVPNLNATAVNWQGAEDDSTTAVNGVPG